MRQVRTALGAYGVIILAWRYEGQPRPIVNLPHFPFPSSYWPTRDPLHVS